MPKLGNYVKLARHAAGKLFETKAVLPAVGTKAPEFACEAHDGSLVRLSELRGHKVLLWFYPKADTPGCTLEGNGFRDQLTEFESKNMKIVGCSFDTPAENQAFAKKFGYRFPLLCDTERKIGMAYGACTSPQAGFADRISFLIDENGVIAASFPKVTPATHTREVLALLES